MKNELKMRTKTMTFLPKITCKTKAIVFTHVNNL